MTKLVFCLRRLSHLSREEFQRYWFDRHAPLVRSHAAALRIRRYVQTHTLSHPLNEALQASRGGPEAFDGVAELWWDGPDDLAAATATPEGRAAGAALLEDERKFIDLERSPLFVATERPIVA
ncbi:MAG TPA: EthD domain-containing protein [Candidatus Eisenbacteria bacterium]|nr:EthD domain-containing protein [Candidatus Eisenbacteria bacterium]